MRRFRFFLFALSFIPVPIAVAQDIASHNQIKTVFIAPLEGQNQAASDLLHAKLISSISKLPNIAIVEDEKDADAILMGSGLIETSNTQYGHTVYHIQFGMRLTSIDKGVVLWADNISSSRFALSASSSFSDNCAKSLGQYLKSRQLK